MHRVPLKHGDEGAVVKTVGSLLLLGNRIDDIQGFMVRIQSNQFTNLH